jgi:hypothetical protein
MTLPSASREVVIIGAGPAGSTLAYELLQGGLKPRIPLAFRGLECYNYLWEVFCRVMRGDRSFGEIKKRCRPDILFRKLLVKSARNRPIA